MERKKILQRLGLGVAAAPLLSSALVTCSNGDENQVAACTPGSITNSDFAN